MITQLKTITHNSLHGVAVTPFEDNLKQGVPQTVLVKMTAKTKIPLHTHAVDAKMYCIGGQAMVLSSDPENDGKAVKTGDLVTFKANVAHGFQTHDSEFTFVSVNGGIVDMSGNWDIAFI